jgi:hypothetical protein
MRSSEGQTKTQENEKLSARFVNAARATGRLAWKAMNGHYFKEARKHFMTPEQRVDYEFTQMLDGVVKKPKQTDEVSAVAQRRGTLTAPNGQRFRIAVARSNMVSDQVSIEPEDGVRRGGPWARTVYFDTGKSRIPGYGGVVRSTVDPTSVADNGRTALSVRGVEGDGFVDEQGISQLGQLLVSTEWEQPEQTDLMSFKSGLQAYEPVGTAY